MHLNSVLQLKYVSAGVFLLQRIKARMDTCSSVIYFIFFRGLSEYILYSLEDYQNIFYIRDFRGLSEYILY